MVVRQKFSCLEPTAQIAQVENTGCTQHVWYQAIRLSVNSHSKNFGENQVIKTIVIR